MDIKAVIAAVRQKQQDRETEERELELQRARKVAPLMQGLAEINAANQRAYNDGVGHFWFWRVGGTAGSIRPQHDSVRAVLMARDGKRFTIERTDGGVPDARVNVWFQHSANDEGFQRQFPIYGETDCESVLEYVIEVMLQHHLLEVV